VAIPSLDSHSVSLYSISCILIQCSKIQIPGCEVIPIPLFHVLNGKDSEDYVARVEPSQVGGRKMAEYLLDVLERSSSKEDAGSKDWDWENAQAPIRENLHR